LDGVEIHAGLATSIDRMKRRKAEAETNGRINETR
jgi:hypothetical protein